jgi:hypothetical protein
VESATDLNPEGPPMVRQVMLSERYTDTQGASQTRPVIAFGSHPDATPNEQHRVPAALVTNQRVRVVLDELLLGNNLEEIRCNELVDDDDFSRVPVGATPDDIAKCAVVKELLPQSCKGAKAVCVRASDGQPVGVRDEVDGAGRPYKDGIADTTRFIAGAAGLSCGDAQVALDLTRSYWQPSGNQQRPAVDDGLRGLLSLGPAVVLVPAVALPTEQTCTVTFDAAVVDKSGVRPCAPPDGDIAQDCVPGDLAAVTFTTEPLRVVQQTPRMDELGVSRFADLAVRGNVDLRTDVTVRSQPPATFAVSVAVDEPQRLLLRPVAPLAANTRYVVEVPLRDSYGRGPAAPFQLTFTTGL